MYLQRIRYQHTHIYKHMSTHMCILRNHLVKGTWAEHTSYSSLLSVSGCWRYEGYSVSEADVREVLLT